MLRTNSSPLTRIKEILKIGKADVIATIFASIYATTLAGLPLMGFMDRVYYLTYARESSQILQNYIKQGWLVLLLNEPLWLLINISLKQLLSPEGVLRVIIFLPAFFVSFIIFRLNFKNAFWIILFLLIPQVLKNHITHLRQGFAIALFLIGWFSHCRTFRFICFSITPFIHSSFFFVLGLMALTSALKYLRLSVDLRFLAFGIAGILVGLGLRWIALYEVGIRQFRTYTFTPGDISGLGFLFWSGILVLMLLQPRRYLRDHAFELGAIVLYLTLYPLVEISARVFESTLLLVLLAGLQMGEPNRHLFLACITIYGALTWCQRLLGPHPAF